MNDKRKPSSRKGSWPLIIGITIGAIVIVAIIVKFFVATESVLTHVETTEGTFPITHWKTTDGLPVYLVTTHELPIVDVVMMFNAGATQDGDQSGISQLTSLMLAEGTTNKTADQIAEKWDSLGSLFSAYSQLDHSVLQLRSLSNSSHLSESLTLFTDVLNKVNFPEEAFTRQQQRLLTALKQKAQRPSAISRDAFYETLYRDHPYANPIEGRKDTIEKLSPDELRAFYKRYYVPQNGVLAMVGDINLKKAKQLAEEISAALPSGEAAPALPPLPSAVNAEENIAFPSTQTHIRIGTFGMRYDDPDYFALVTGNNILGGHGLVSRLFKKVREEKGLAYNVTSAFDPMEEKGPFIIYLQTRTDQTDQAKKIVKETLDDFLTQGPTDQELSAAKQYLTGSFALKLGSNEAIVSQIAKIGYYQLPINFLNTYTAHINHVTKEDIKRAFDSHINADQLVSISVGKQPGK